MTLVTTLRDRRKRMGLSQAELAARVGISRQAVVAIEGGQQSPQTAVALGLARTLRCGVEDIFALPAVTEARPAVAPSPDGDVERSSSGRLAMGRVGGRWVAHALDPADPSAAHALAAESDDEPVHLLETTKRLERQVLVAGCAPLLGTWSARFGARYVDEGLSWIPASSGHALDLLEAGYVHMAGIHLGGTGDQDTNLARVQAAYPGREMLLVHLTRWTQGILTAPGNPLGIDDLSDLMRPRFRFAHRDHRAGTHSVVDRDLTRRGGSISDVGGPKARDHAEVASMVRLGVADAGVAIESVAVSEGVDFIPLITESFDLVVAADDAEEPHIARVLSSLWDAGFRMEGSRLPGYDVSDAGDMVRTEVAPDTPELP